MPTSRERWRVLRHGAGDLIVRWADTLSHLHRHAAPPAPAAPAAPAPAQPTAPIPASPLYQHVPHPHIPQHAAERHKAALQSAGFNARLAVWITTHVGTMTCAYIFAGIGVGSLVGIATGQVVLAAVFGSISSYFLQLVLLPIISVGQEQGNKHQELQSEEQFLATQRTLHEADQMARHLNAQDEELLRQTKMLEQMIASGAPARAPAPPAAPASPRKRTPRASTAAASVAAAAHGASAAGARAQ